MPNEPKTQALTTVKLSFDLGNLLGRDFGRLVRKFEFRAMINGGYIIRARLYDSDYDVLNTFIEEGYFREARRKPIVVTFQLMAGSQGVFPETATKAQQAIIMSLEGVGGTAHRSELELIAIDPPAWFLNTGDASGKVYKGRVDQVMRQVIAQYAPLVNAEVGRTVDSDSNRWGMMRQDPKTFIASLTDWSSSITLKKTNWLIESDGYDFTIKEQGAMASKQRAFYRYGYDVSSSIRSISIKADNALSIIQSKLVTAGSAAISGQYLDRVSDTQEQKVFVKDETTSNKQIARTNTDQSFLKPPDAGPGQVGWTEIPAIPEIYSAGDLGLKYDDYIDGRSRGIWLGMINSLLRIKLTVYGHGEWSSCRGLGVDTIFVKWGAVPKSDQGDFWWVTGNWLVYGFHHTLEHGLWVTDLYCSRFDTDSIAKKVAGGNS